jgi:hypothetical protein
MNITTERTVKPYRQHVNTKRVYELNVDSHPLATNPVWSLTHSRDGSPVPHSIAALETSTDALSARLVTHDWPGLVKVTVTFGIHPRTTITESFEVQIEPVPHVSPELKLAFSQHRDRPL